MVWWRWHINVSHLCCCWSLAFSFRVASITVCVCTLKATMVVFCSEVCITFTAMNSRTLLSDHVMSTGSRMSWRCPQSPGRRTDLNTQRIESTPCSYLISLRTHLQVFCSFKLLTPQVAWMFLFLSSCYKPQAFHFILLDFITTDLLIFCNELMVNSNPQAVAYWGGGLGCSNPPPPKFRRPPKIVPNSTRLWKLLKIAEFRAPTPQDVRKKGSKILKLPSVRNCFTLAMTNKLVVTINIFKEPKIKKMLLYEMKFLVPN